MSTTTLSLPWRSSQPPIWRAGSGSWRRWPGATRAESTVSPSWKATLPSSVGPAARARPGAVVSRRDFLDAHRHVLMSLIEDLDRLGTGYRAMAGRIVAEEMHVIERLDTFPQ